MHLINITGIKRKGEKHSDVCNVADRYSTFEVKMNNSNVNELNKKVEILYN